jgi:hypothetical protein
MKKTVTFLMFALLFNAAVVYAQNNISAQKKIMFVGMNATPDETSSDPRVITELTAQGFTVEYFAQADVAMSGGAFTVPAAGTAFADAAAVVVSSTVASGATAALVLHSVSAAVAKPILLWENANFDEAGVMSSTVSMSPKVAVTGSAITATMNLALNAGYHGGNATVDFATAPYGINVSGPHTLAAGAVSIATTVASSRLDASVDSLISVATLLPKGAIDRNGGASGADVICWSMFNNNNPLVTNAGWQLFVRAVCVLANKAYVPPTTGVNNFASNVNAKTWYSNGELHLEVWKNLTNSPIAIYSSEGRLVATKYMTGNGKFIVPVENLSKGMYMVRGEGFSGKLVIQ